MELKHCTAADVETLRAIGEQTYRETFAAHNTDEDMENYLQGHFTVQQVKQELANPNSTFVLALENGRPQGYLKLNYGPAQTELQDEAALEVERIYISRESQGKGLGQQLLDYAIETARNVGKEYVWLGVWEHNQKALAFYHKNGFVRFSEHIYQLGDDKQLDYMLRKNLA